MDIIQQNLVVQEWPLSKPDDEQFFGYLLALGVHPYGWNGQGMFLYADFAFRDSYVRYRLPNEYRLINQLFLHLGANFQTAKDVNDIFGKVHIKLTDQGHVVTLP